MVDIHCHLTHPPLYYRRSSIVRKCRELGIKGIVDCITSIDMWEKELERNDKEIYLSLGIHPQIVEDKDYSEELSILDKLVKNKRVVAIGEIGFDKYKKRAAFSKQRNVFLKQLEIAQKHSLPVIVHCFGYYDQLLSILKEKKIDVPVILHRYSAGDGQVNAFSKINCFFSYSGDVLNTYNKKVQKSIIKTDNNRILAETDAPYLKIDNRIGTPCDLPLIIERIAELKNIKFKSIKEQINGNIKRAFLGRIHFEN